MAVSYVELWLNDLRRPMRRLQGALLALCWLRLGVRTREGIFWRRQEELGLWGTFEGA